MIDSHELFMRRCLEIAGNGSGLTAPNPMVGAVIVHNGQIIGEGYHTGFGKAHAEVEAVNQVKEKDLLKHSTLYVNLEPCNHIGKTPACSDLIINSGIPRVVIGQPDPNTQAGGGIARMREHGVEVITGVLEEESRWLNRRFNTFHEKRRPYLILKWAQSIDGFVDVVRTDPASEQPAQISDEVCRRWVHKWRSEEQAIMVGAGTLRMDNPRLDVRVWSGNNPLRIVIAPSTGLKPDPGVHLLDGSLPTVVYTYGESLKFPNLEFVTLSKDAPLMNQVFEDLYSRNIISVLIEGGPTLHQSLIDSGLWDEARVFSSQLWLGKGIPAAHLPHQPLSTQSAGNSQILLFTNLTYPLTTP
jgi:diaminohydroxyphosphoribosylaminopyrimidine deaminase/5-amino-6-(5-phosphoribosylamino)uracil reductase